jgi:hypothetical protein
MPSCDRQERISYKVQNRDIVVKASFSLLGLVDNCRFSLVIFCYLINITYLNGTSSFSILFIEVVKMSTLHFFCPTLYSSPSLFGGVLTKTLHPHVQLNHRHRVALDESYDKFI